MIDRIAYKSKCKISKIGVTDDTLTGRGGMALFVKYLGSVEIYPLLHSFFGDVRRNNKGLPVWNIFKQVLCWFYDGTSRHLTSFAQLKRDEGYASVIENGQEEIRLASAETIIESHHMRGADELPHRGLKDFGFEELPFERFVPNSVVYYCKLISFFLFETFKEDVLVEVIPIGSYATTVRRKVFDFAAKIIGTGRQLILKVNQAVMDNLRFDILWQRSQIPIPIII